MIKLKKIITTVILKSELDTILNFYKDVYDSFNNIGLTVYLSLPTMFDESYISFMLPNNHEIQYIVKQFNFVKLVEKYYFDHYSSKLLKLNFEKFIR